MSTKEEAMTENPSLSGGSAISHKDYIFGDGRRREGDVILARHSLEPQRNFSLMSGLAFLQ